MIFRLEKRGRGRPRKEVIIRFIPLANFLYPKPLRSKLSIKLYLDEIEALRKHVLKTGKVVDLAVSGNYHQAGIGYCNKTLYVAAPGFQPWYRYVGTIGRPLSARGFIVLHEALPDYFRAEFVLDDAINYYLREMRKSGYKLEVWEEL